MVKQTVELSELPKVTFRYGGRSRRAIHCRTATLDQNDPDGQPIFVSDGCQPRASKFFRKLSKELSRAGYSIGLPERIVRHEIGVVSGDWHVPIRLREATRRVRVREDHGREGFAYVPTGLLVLKIGDYPAREFKEGKERILDDRSGEILEHVRTRHLEDLQVAKEREEARAHAEEVAREREEQLRLSRAAEARFQELSAHSERWEQCRRIQRYLDAIESRLTAEGTQALSEEAKLWLEETRSFVQSQDPLSNL